ncbi:MAG: hypothetical protein KKD44_14605 [Proteobacteria bacterium]|nr:hypothetical protein [Pseudomonadota bacterium]
MNEKLAFCNRKTYENFEMALKGLERASEIAVKLGLYPCEVDRLREQELKELRQHFSNR